MLIRIKKIMEDEAEGEAVVQTGEDEDEAAPDLHSRVKEKPIDND